MAFEFKAPEGHPASEKIIDAQVQHASRLVEQGVMGWLFGAGQEKPGNIAGFAIIVACLMIVVVAYIPASPDFPKRELLTAFAGIIPGALGFVFGRASGKA